MGAVKGLFFDVENFWDVLFYAGTTSVDGFWLKKWLSTVASQKGERYSYVKSETPLWGLF